MEIKELTQLIEAVSASDLTGLRYEEGGMKLHLTKKQGKIQMAAIPAELEAVSKAEPKAPAENTDANVVTSPLVGTFYAAPSEDAEAFVAVGDQVKKGQTLAIIEAMKLMNEIESEYDGVVEEICVSNGQAVEYGQELFRIR